MRISDTYARPFPDVGLSEDDFVPIEKLIGKEITITDTQTFENGKGPGIYILFTQQGRQGYTTTHSINIINILSREAAVAALDAGDVIDCTVVKRPSQKDKSKTVYTLE